MKTLLENPLVAHMLQETEEILNRMEAVHAAYLKEGKSGDAEIIGELIRTNERLRDSIIGNDLEQAIHFCEHSHGILDRYPDLFDEIAEQGI